MTQLALDLLIGFWSLNSLAFLSWLLHPQILGSMAAAALIQSPSYWFFNRRTFYFLRLLLIFPLLFPTAALAKYYAIHPRAAALPRLLAAYSPLLIGRPINLTHV